MAKKMQVKESGRPPYVMASRPTEQVADGLDHAHEWVKGPIRVIERIPHRGWTCSTPGCNYAGLSVEFVLKDPS